MPRLIDLALLNQNTTLQENHASNTEVDKAKDQDKCFQSSELYELRQPSTLFGIANETLDDTSISNEKIQEVDYHMMTGGLLLADHHMVTGPTKNILRQSSNNTNFLNTLGRSQNSFSSSIPNRQTPSI